MKSNYRNLQNDYIPQEANNEDGILKCYFKSAKNHSGICFTDKPTFQFSLQLIYEKCSHYSDTLKYLLHINSSAMLISAKIALF